MPRMLVRNATSGPILPAPATIRESDDDCCNAIDVTISTATVEPISIRIATRRMALPSLTSSQPSDTQCVDTGRGVTQTITRAGITVQISAGRVTLPTPLADSEDRGAISDTNAVPNPVAEERTTQVSRPEPLVPSGSAPVQAYPSVETQAGTIQASGPQPPVPAPVQAYPSVETHSNSPLGFYAPNLYWVRIRGRLAFRVVMRFLTLFCILNLRLGSGLSATQHPSRFGTSNTSATQCIIWTWLYPRICDYQ